MKISSRLYEPAILGANSTSILIAILIANTGQRVKIFDYDQNKTSIEDKIIRIVDHLNHKNLLPFSGAEIASLLLPRNYREHWSELADHDLIFECCSVQEKKGWLTRLAPAFNKNAMIVSLSEGAPISEIVNALPAGLRPHLIGAHFFLPIKKHRLVEIIPVERSEPQLINKISHYFEDILGLFPIISEDKPNFIANRFFIFATLCLFHHAKTENISILQLEQLSHVLTGYQNGGICRMLDEMGLDRFQNLAFHTLRDSSFLTECFSIPTIIENLITQGNYGIDSGKGFYDYSQTPAAFISQNEEPIAPTLLQAIEETNWKLLKSIDSAQSRFVCHFLRDLWQFMMRLNEETDLKGDILDKILRYGFSWNIGPYLLLQAFSPAHVYETTLEDKRLGLIQYPVSNTWKRRTRTSTKIRHAHEDFLSQCALIKQTEFSQWWLYRERMLIWNPHSDILSFYIPQLNDLKQATEYAKKKDCALMIYHHGSQFGGAKHWRQHSHDNDDYIAEHEALKDTLLALRMLPSPVVLSVSGMIMDYGFAIMMQADRVICDRDVSWRLRAIEHGLPAVGGIWFEWLRRLPHLSKELEYLQIHTVLAHLLSSGGIHSLFSAKELGILRSHDRIAVNRKHIPKLSQTIANAWIDIDLSRPMRFSLHKLNAATIEMLDQRSHDTAQPELYRHFIRLLAEDEQRNILSLRQFLKSENQLFTQLFLNKTANK